MAASVESLENALTELRWNPEGLGEETYDAYLTLVANYPDYILLVTGDGMPMAPDDKGRRLAPVFTTNAAFEAFHREVLAAAGHRNRRDSVSPIAGYGPARTCIQLLWTPAAFGVCSTHDRGPD